MQTMATTYAGRGQVSGIAQQWVDTVGVAPWLSYWVRPFAGGVTPVPFSNLPLDYHATGSGHVYTRTRWDASSAVVHLQLGGPPVGGGHLHDDWGNWQLWRGGRWLSRETTSYSESFAGYGGSGAASSIATIVHNGLIINPDAQGCVAGTSCIPNGSAGEYDDINGPPVLRRLESQPGYLFASVDLSSAYRNDQVSPGHPERDNPAASHVERDFVFLRGLETLVIFDRVETRAVGAVPAGAIRRAFIAHCEVPWETPDATHATCTNGAQALRLVTLVPAAPGQHVTAEGGAVGQSRLEVTVAGAALEYLLTVVQARAADGADLTPTVVDTGSAFTVKLDAQTTVTFEKGRVSAGGSVSLAGVASALRSGVQPMTITNDGPVWQ